MSINPKQVQLRGGSEIEHEEFIGANREVTVDTTNKTLRVHDGITPGGNKLSTSKELSDESEKINRRIDDIQHNIANSHNHDDLYVKNIDGVASNLRVGVIDLIGRDLKINNKRALVGFGNNEGNNLFINFENDYGNGVVINGNVDIPNNLTVKGRRPFLDRHINGYYGFCTPEADDGDWIRTTRNGLIPYQSGGYSSLGTSSWRFNDGWFNNINTKTITVAKNGDTSCIEFPGTVNDPGFIRHIENNNTSGMYFSVSDDITNGDRFYFGSAPGGNFRATAHITSEGDLWLERGLTQNNWTISVGGVQIYFNGERPSNAPNGSISFG